MKIKITAFLTAWITIASTFVNAQTTLNINGKITDTNSKGIDGATIYLKRATDSTLVKTALADSSGNYQLVNLKKGEYIISVTMIGYANYKSGVVKLDNSLVLPTIILQQSGTALKEVTITSRKPFVEHQIDKTVVNVDALISNTGSTALDVLGKSPGVIVDDNGAITLKGKNVQIFIDDKPTNLSGTDLQNYLQSLPSSTIDQLELMTVPPAKYDAAGNGGIINIRTKKSKVKGFNGGLNLAFTQGRYERTNNSFNFNYRENKINIFGNFSFNTYNSFSDLTINRHFLNPDGTVASNFLEHTYAKRQPQNYRGQLGLDYYASEKTTWGIVLSGLINPFNSTSHVVSTLLSPQNMLDSTIVANNAEHRHFTDGGINLNYRHQFDKKGTEVTADVDYINYAANDNQSFDNVTYQPDGTVTNSDLLTGHLPSSINIFAAKTDFNHTLTGGFKLSVGLKTSYTQTDNIANYFDTEQGVTTPNYDETNHFIYKENINAAYISVNKEFKRFTVQAGLRFENTMSNGHQLGNPEKPDSVFQRNYSGLFPTLYFQYKLDTAGKQTLGFNYSRRIDRPNYNELNPFVSPLDKFTYYTGNPFLNPSYTQSVELTHTWKNFTTTLSYSKTLGDDNETIEIVNGIYYSKPANIGEITQIGLSVDGSFDVTKWFDVHFYGFVSNLHSQSNFYTGLLNTQGTFFVISPIAEFKIDKSWTAQVDGNYRSKLTDNQFILGARGRINSAVSKKLSPSTTLKLAANDIFHSFVNSGIINNLANTKADYRNIGDSQNITLSLSYRFGKTISDQRKHNAHAAESEQNRVGN